MRQLQLKNYPFTMFLLAIMLVLAIGLLDYRTGPEISLLIFYTIPVLHATWFINYRAGIAISLASAGMWFFCQYILPGEEILLAVSLWNMTVRLGIFLLIVYIVSIQAALNKSLNREKALARTDSLTGALNSRAFNEAVTREINRARRYGHPFSVAYIDLDNFKAVNDTLGHTIGDKLLKIAVQTLQDASRATDLVARIGGDEFAMLLPNTSQAGAMAMIEKSRLELLVVMRKNHWPVSASIGLATFVAPPESYDALIHLTDELMYEAKKAGKNRIVSAVIHHDGEPDSTMETPESGSIARRGYAG